MDGLLFVRHIKHWFVVDVCVGWYVLDQEYCQGRGSFHGW